MDHPPSPDDPASQLSGWLRSGTAAVCWLHAGNTAAHRGAMQDLLAETPGSKGLWLLDGSPESLLRECFGTTSAAALRAALSVAAPPLVVLDAVEQVQGRDGRIFDARIHALLDRAALGPDRPRVLVRSSMPPPTGLAGAALRLGQGAEGDIPLPNWPEADELDRLEQQLRHHLAAGDTDAAVMGYWAEIGNFGRLETLGELHRGIRLCWLLNGRSPPTAIDPALAAHPGAQAVLNDWAVMSLCTGDAASAAEAARSALSLATETCRGSDLGMIKGHLAEALWQQGEASAAMDVALSARRNILATMRQREGIPTEDVMTAYDGAYHAMLRSALGARDVKGGAAILDEWIDVHFLAHRNLREFNAHSVLPVGRPMEQVRAEDILHGHPAAEQAACEERWAEVRRIVSEAASQRSAAWPRGRRGLAMQLLDTRALLGLGDWPAARRLLSALREPIEQADDGALCCEWAAVEASLASAQGDPARCLAVCAGAVGLASGYGLLRQRAELQALQASALEAQGRFTDAAAVRAALPAPPPVQMPPRITPPRRSLAPAPRSTRQAGEPRSELHQAALDAIGRYRDEGLPFALSFRTFSFTVFHGPMEFGPRLLENVLSAAMPAGATVLAIQDQGDLLPRQVELSRHSRSAPALVLDDAAWKDVAVSLIAHADLIVSECHVLTPGVRFELDAAYRLGRWDRTVLVIPPHGAIVATIDDDPLIQMFPRCVWANVFHDELLAEQPQVKDLVERMARIAALPLAERRTLTDPVARDAAFPIDLLSLAGSLERATVPPFSYAKEDLPLLRHEAFWNYFRAAALRGVAFQRGDKSAANRLALAMDSMEMARWMISADTEDERYILLGEIADAEKLARSAHALLRADGVDSKNLFKPQVERLWDDIQRVKAAMAAQPERFVARPVFGPLAGLG